MIPEVTPAKGGRDQQAPICREVPVHALAGTGRRIDAAGPAMRPRRSRALAASALRTSSIICALMGVLPAGRAVAQQAPLPAAPAAASPVPASAGAPPTSLKAADAAEQVAAAQDEILVVGHRQHGAVATDVPPEVTVNAVAIRALGAADLREVFEELAPEIRNGQSGPGAQLGTPIVLVNGQRIAAFNSIQQLPPEAVRRIEIFPEKVALQYGYAPGQRVVNVVLRSQYRALTLLGRFTAATSGGRDIYRAKADLLRINETSHWDLGFDYIHQSPIFADTTLGAPGTTGKVPDHTLLSQDNHLSLNGEWASLLGKVNVDLTARLDLDALVSRPGLSDEDGALLAAEASPDLIDGPLHREDKTADAQATATFNGNFGDWHWSAVNRLDERTRQTRTHDASDTGGLTTIVLPTPGLFGDRCAPDDTRECVSTTTRTASSDAYLNGDLFRMPAGAVTASIHTGVAWSDIHSGSAITGDEAGRDRTQGTIQGNIDVPITRQASAIGKLSVGVNGEADQLSDFNTLGTLGGSLEWSPIDAIDLLATFNRRQQAPTLFQLGEATLPTPDLREFDFTRDATTIVQQVSGGNPDLQHQTSDVTDIRLQVKPIRDADLTLSGEYTRARIRNPIVDITAATAATEAAFPDRFTDSDSGYLTSLAIGPVNLARRDTQQIRYGITWSSGLGKAGPTGGKTGRDQVQIAIYDTWRLQDDVVLADGQPMLDLLGHDIISDRGGTANHEIEVQTSLSTGLWSLNLNADWQTPTSGYAGLTDPDKLTFTQGVTLGVKLILNLEDYHWLNHLLPFLRGSLNLSADNVLGAHTRVHAADGTVPLAYTSEYLRPGGPTFRLTLRKRFR